MGKPWNHRRVHRVYCQMRLNQKRSAKRRLPTRERQPLMATQTINAYRLGELTSADAPREG